MKKSKLPALKLMAIILATSSLSVYADKDQCPQDAVHCAYFTGISNNLNDGRYIKISNKYIDIVVCFNGTSTVFLDQSGAGNYRGPNSDSYAICTDSGGGNCERVGIDKYIVSEGNNGFIAAPKFFDVNLSKIVNKFPPCNSAQKSFRFHR